MTETITIEKPENPETLPSNMVCQWKVFNIDNIIIYWLKNLKTKNRTMIFSKTLTETSPLKKPKNFKISSWNIVCQWKLFNNDYILYIVSKVLKNAIQRKNFQNHKLKPNYWRNPKTLKLYPDTWYVKEKF